MALIAVAGFGTANADARAIVVGVTIVGATAGVAAAMLLLRGQLRVPAALLVLSAIIPTWAATVVNLVPLVLAVVLVARSFDTGRAGRAPAPDLTGAQPG